jgi:hypothetical protein
MSEAAYDFSKVASGYDVVVTPASAPTTPLFVQILFIVLGGGIGVPLVGVGLLFMFVEFWIGLFLTAFGALFLYLIFYKGWWGYHKLRCEKREKNTFSITPTELRVTGLALSISNIHRFTLRNHVTNQARSAGATGTGVAVIPVSIAVGQQIFARWQARLARVSWRVDVEANGKASTLGFGLDETTAHGLMEDTVRKIAEVRAT